MFLYIFQDGECQQSKHRPTPQDLRQLIAGNLTVLRFVDGGFERVYHPMYGIQSDTLGDAPASSLPIHEAGFDKDPGTGEYGHYVHPEDSA